MIWAVATQLCSAAKEVKELEGALLVVWAVATQSAWPRWESPEWPLAWLAQAMLLSGQALQSPKGLSSEEEGPVSAWARGSPAGQSLPGELVLTLRTGPPILEGRSHRRKRW